MATEDIQVVTDPSAPDPGATIVVDGGPAVPGVDDLQRQMAELETASQRKDADLAAERQRASDAERRASEAAATLQSVQSEVQDSRLAIIDNAIAARESEVSRLKGDLTAAWSGGAFDKAADVQASMNRLAAEIVQLEGGKQALSEAPRQEPARQSGDQIEDWISKNIASRRSQDYLRQHRDYVSDPQKFQRVQLAHQLATIEQGIAPDSDEYFAFIDDRMAGGQTRVTEQPAKTPPAAQRRTPTPAASSGKSAEGAGNTANQVYLTASERAAARTLMDHKTGKPMGEKEYARRKLLIQQNNGRLPNTDDAAA